MSEDTEEFDRQITMRARRILDFIAFAMTPEEEKRTLRFIEGEIRETVRQAADEKAGRRRDCRSKTRGYWRRCRGMKRNLRE